MLKGLLRLSMVLASWMFALTSLASAEDSPAPQLVFAVHEDDRRVAEQLGAMLDQSLEVQVLEAAAEVSYARGRAQELGRALVLVLHGTRSSVYVVRVADGMVLARELDPHAATASGLAFVAAELLALAQQLERGRAPVDPRTLAIVLGAAGDLSLLAPYALAVRPALELRVLAGRADRPFFWEFALHSAIRAAAEAALSEVSLHRSELSLRVQRGARRERLSLACGVVAGMAITAAELDGETTRRRLAMRAGAVLTGEVRAFGPVALFARAVGSASGPRREYRVEGIRALREPIFALDLELGLSVTLHSR